MVLDGDRRGVGNVADETRLQRQTEFVEPRLPVLLAAAGQRWRETILQGDESRIEQGRKPECRRRPAAVLNLVHVTGVVRTLMGKRPGLSGEPPPAVAAVFDWA